LYGVVPPGSASCSSLHEWGLPLSSCPANRTSSDRLRRCVPLRRLPAARPLPARLLVPRLRPVGAIRPVSVRPRGLSPPRRFSPRCRSRACCIPHPTLGFNVFQQATSLSARERPRAIACFPTKRFTPFEDFPSPAAAPCLHGRCPPAVVQWASSVIEPELGGATVTCPSSGTRRSWTLDPCALVDTPCQTNPARHVPSLVVLADLVGFHALGGSAERGVRGLRLVTRHRGGSRPYADPCSGRACSLLRSGDRHCEPAPSAP